MTSRALAEIEPVERLIEHQHGRRCQQADRQQHSAMLALRQLAKSRAAQRLEGESVQCLADALRGRAVQSSDEPKDPSHSLVGPRANAVRHEIEKVFPPARFDRDAAASHGSECGGRHSGETLEQRGFARAVRSDETEDFSWANRKSRASQRPELSEALREVVDENSGGGAGLRWRFVVRGRKR
jgi:hypothetical protein